MLPLAKDSYGRQMKSTASNAQLLAPTHLPQAIASSVLLAKLVVSALWVCERTLGKNING